MIQLILTLLSICALGHTETLSFKETGSTLNRSIVFIHGTPGSAKAFETYYEDDELKSLYHMVSVDRLGFGKSSKKSETSLLVHADSTLKLLKEHWPEKKFTCIGHSYGVPVCLKMFLLDSERFNAGVMLAGAVNPNRKILRWYNYWANTWFIKLFLSRAFENSNDEMKALRGELYQLEPELEKIKKKMLIVHGQKDKIVPFEDSTFLKERLVNSTLKRLTPKDMGHMFIWSKKDYLKQELKLFFNSLEE